MRRLAAGALAASLLTACAAAPVMVPRPAPTCSGEADCAAKWEAAQVFVAKNAGLKIQIATSVLIETFNPPEYSTSLAMRAMKEPKGKGEYEISVFAWCRNSFGCRRKPEDVVADFIAYVNAAAP